MKWPFEDMKGHWKDLTLGLKRSTILFLAGVHGKDSGELGLPENIQTLKIQVKNPEQFKNLNLDVFE